VTSESNSLEPFTDSGYAYDAIGNRIERVTGTTSLTGIANYSSNGQNQYDSIPEFSRAPQYDLDGNLEKYPQANGVGFDATYTWDGENRLIKYQPTIGTGTSYSYDYLGRRIKKVKNVGQSAPEDTTYYVYDGWNCVGEIVPVPFGSEPPVLRKSYTWGLDLSGSMQGAGGVGGLLEMQTYDVNRSQTAVYYPTYDGNGNVSEYLDSSGDEVAHFEYDPFGNLTSSNGSTSTFDIRFSTKKRDSETGFSYYGYRYYDPVTGRWPSRDPIEENGGLNLYGFLGNDGIGRWDLLGQKFEVYTGTDAGIDPNTGRVHHLKGFIVSYTASKENKKKCDEILLSQAISYKGRGDDLPIHIDNHGFPVPAVPVGSFAGNPKPDYANESYWDAPKNGPGGWPGTWKLEVVAICLRCCLEEETATHRIVSGTWHGIQSITFDWDNAARTVSNLEHHDNPTGRWWEAYNKWANRTQRNDAWASARCVDLPGDPTIIKK